MDKVRLQDGETLYLEIDKYYRFDALAPHLINMDIGLNELNDLAGELARLDTTQGIAYRGLLEMAVQEKVQSNGGIITMQELRDLAVSAGEDCCHVVDAADDAQLGRFYAENDFMPELEGYQTRYSRCWTSPKSARRSAPARAAFMWAGAMWCGTAVC